MKETIYSASHGFCKNEAIKESWENIFGYRPDVIPTGAPSGVNEQPYGLDEAKRGCDNRLRNSIRKIGEHGIFVVIESTIVKVVDDYFDVPFLKIHTEKGSVSIAGTATQFPTKAVEKTRKLGFKKNTVGSYLAKKHIVKDAKDPHIDLCGISRKDLLVKDLETLFRMALHEGLLVREELVV